MKIAVIGGGPVGASIGSHLARNVQYSVCYGSRDPSSSKIQQLLASQPGTTAKPTQDAVQWGDILLLTVPVRLIDAESVKELASFLGPGTATKIIIDATNPTTAYPKLEVLWNGTSAGELLQAGLADSYVFKAFNYIGWEMMAKPDALGVLVNMMFAGPDGPEKGKVTDLIKDAGFDPVYIGPILYSRHLEALAELWIHLGVSPAGFTSVDFGRYFAFNVVRKDPSKDAQYADAIDGTDK